ncbi:MAG: hypothetical protein AB7O26_18945 [Planctomycetaceae bacterium]
MSIDALVTIAVSLATGFGIWMFRIDRICTRLESKLGEVSEWRQTTSAQIGRQGTKLDNHAGRIARLEALGEHR